VIFTSLIFGSYSPILEGFHRFCQACELCGVRSRLTGSETTLRSAENGCPAQYRAQLVEVGVGVDATGEDVKLSGVRFLPPHTLE
jgi:hypothetical protein